jgi:2-oxoglutarate ferredoxin oxidoreductase subunit beta
MADVKMEHYRNTVERAWCPGCGNFGILNLLQKTLVDLQIPPQRVLLCSGIGQAPKIVHYLNANAFDGLTARVGLGAAAKMVADDLTVIVHAGDGAPYGEGATTSWPPCGAT